MRKTINKLCVALLIAIMTTGLVACSSGNKGGSGSSGNTLMAPEVKDGIMSAGEEAVEVRFEWTAVDGADGYEVSERSKYRTDTEYGPEETTQTKDTFYISSAQDDFDFAIKVRAYKGSGDNVIYSDWSTEAKGSSY